MNTPWPAAVNIHKKISKVKNCMNTKTEKLLVTKIILCIFSWSNYCYMCTIYTSGSLMHIIFCFKFRSFFYRCIFCLGNLWVLRSKFTCNNTTHIFDCLCNSSFGDQKSLKESLYLSNNKVL